MRGFLNASPPSAGEAADNFEENGVRVELRDGDSSHSVSERKKRGGVPQRVDAELRRFLSRAYNLKVVADHEAGPGSVVPCDRAEAAIITALRFVDCVAALLS
jgi:hypothetical protein